MELSKQVVSLELAKRLKELGVKQESIFSWCLNPRPDDTWYIADQVWTDDRYSLRDKVSAFTVAELGESLKDYQMECLWFEEKRQWGCFQTLDGRDAHYADTEADARAKMLIYLLENKLITV